MLDVCFRVRCSYREDRTLVEGLWLCLHGHSCWNVGWDSMSVLKLCLFCVTPLPLWTPTPTEAAGSIWGVWAPEHIRGSTEKCKGQFSLSTTWAHGIRPRLSGV